MAVKKKKTAKKKSVKKTVKPAQVKQPENAGPDSLKLMMAGIAAVAVVIIMIIAAAALKPKPSAPDSSGITLAESQEQPDTAVADENVKPDFKKLFQEVSLKQEIHKIDIDAAKYLFDSGRAVFVDSRSKGEYDRQRIKGSIFLPVNASQDEIDRAAKKYRGKVLVTYCHGSGCHLADKVAYRLFDAGHKKLAIFWGGWPKWDEHKYPETLGN